MHVMYHGEVYKHNGSEGFATHAERKGINWKNANLEK